jgi:hypothetical protein
MYDGLRSAEASKAAKGLRPYAFLEAFMFMGLVILTAAGFIDFVGNTDFPGLVWQLPHVVTILFALVIGQFFFWPILWPSIILYGAACALDAATFIWHAVSTYRVYAGELPSFYLDQAFIRLWVPVFLIGILMIFDIGQIIRLTSIDRHERNYQTEKDRKKQFRAYYRSKAIKTFGRIIITAVVDAVFTIVYFLVVFYYITGSAVSDLIWIQSIHFVAWLIAEIAAGKREFTWIVIMMIFEILALTFDIIVFGVYLASLIFCMNGTSPQSCTDSQAEEILMTFLTLILIVIDVFQVVFSVDLFNVHRKFNVNWSK